MIRQPEREQLNRLTTKTLDQMFIMRVKEGLSCSQFEAGATFPGEKTADGCKVWERGTSEGSGTLKTCQECGAVIVESESQDINELADRLTGGIVAAIGAGLDCAGDSW